MTGEQAALLVLQRIFKLQKKTAVADDALAFLEAAGDLRAALVAVAERDKAAGEFVGTGLDIHEGHVFRVPQDRGVGNDEGAFDDAGLDGGGDVHVALQFPARILSDDAGLERARGRIESGRDVGDAAVERVVIGFGVDVHGIAETYPDTFHGRISYVAPALD